MRLKKLKFVVLEILKIKFSALDWLSKLQHVVLTKKISRFLNFNVEDVELTLDTSVEVSTITISTVERLGLVSRASDEYLSAADGCKLKVAGVVRVHIQTTHAHIFKDFKKRRIF